MAEKQAEMKRKKPPAVIIARGRKISHFALRPWMVAAGGTVLLVLCIVYPGTAEIAQTTNRLAPLVERASRLQPMPDMPLKPAPDRHSQAIPDEALASHDFPGIDPIITGPVPNRRARGAH
ncbi:MULTISPECIES: peptidase M23 [unclassified Brucella]|uniref:peptidase M23 n=1 Tax=unclassified Brucella TaxID=2632610 RepID=UPI0009728C02|nr:MULTISPECIES: peptidase M23 [unclassified Brucella]APX69074.1 peptidase M23 [Brucella sp. 09RB8471]MRN79416.1 peptidase M23 [Brucella sp. 10RB9210]QGA55948.1 peptidase M23 [Brucella sp. 2280]